MVLSGKQKLPRSPLSLFKPLDLNDFATGKPSFSRPLSLFDSAYQIPKQIKKPPKRRIFNFLERVSRIELPSHPWQGRIIATIRYPHAMLAHEIFNLEF